MSDSDDASSSHLPERVHWQDEAAVKIWAERLGVTPGTLRETLIAVGPEIAVVRRFLRTDGPGDRDPGPLTAGRQTTSRILLVEEDALVRAFLIRILNDHGCIVVAAATPTQARKMMKGRFAAAVIDGGGPGQHREDFAMELRMADSQLPLVITTGHDVGHVYSRFGEDGATAICFKPFRSSDLIRLLTSLNVFPRH